MRKTLSVLAIIAALSSSALAAVPSSATLTGGTLKSGRYEGNGNVTIAEGSTVSISNGVFGKKSEWGPGASSVSGATVTMTGGYLSCSVYGGETESMDCNTTSNTVTISGGTVTNDVIGGYSKNGDANNNTVTISGGEVGGSVYGGKASFNKANYNTVTISGGKVTGTVYGGYSENSAAVGNTVNLVGVGATLGTLTGSNIKIDGSVVGDTLNVYGKGITIGGVVGQFKTANFYLAPGTKNGDTIMTSNTFNAQKLNVKCDGATKLNGGDKVTLVHTIEGVATYTESNVDIIKGVTASYSGTVAEDNGDIVLTLEGGSPTPGPIPGPVPGPGVKVETNTLKSMTETRTDVAALVNAAADFMSTTGMQQAKMAAKAAAKAGKYDAAPFVALGGSHLRYNTGSHVDADGFNGALGVAKSFGETTLGIAGEYGLSSYKSYVGGVRGKGDSKLYGGALLADWQGTQGWHAEGAVRVGRTSTDYSAMTPLGYTHYTDHASYQGALIGGGKEFKVNRKSDDTLDLYARYMYGHTNGSNAKASSGESMHFAGVDSHRTMVGARYNHELTDKALVYAGIAWMHEFDGDARSVIGGFTSPTPSLKGNSGMVELGTTFAPCDSESVLLNLNVQGWTGVQRGISGGAGCTIKF